METGTTSSHYKLVEKIGEGEAYARSVASGHLLFVNGGTLFAAPFDPDTGTLGVEGVDHGPRRRGRGAVDVPGAQAVVSRVFAKRKDIGD